MQVLPLLAAQLLLTIPTTSVVVVVAALRPSSLPISAGLAEPVPTVVVAVVEERPVPPLVVAPQPQPPS